MTQSFKTTCVGLWKVWLRFSLDLPGTVLGILYRLPEFLVKFDLNDLVHGWGVDMKLGYCAQGDRTKKVGVVDSEYVFHQGIQTLGGSGHRMTKQKQGGVGIDVRTEIRRQSTWEFEIFKERWNEAIAADKNWVDPFKSDQRRIRKRRDTQRLPKNNI
ncbi:hypothetical protein HKD37_13G037688 [Glycine soja]